VDDGKEESMKRIAVILVASLALAAVLGVWGLRSPSGASAAGRGKVADHALFDETSGDVGVRCRTTTSSPFIVYLSVRAINASATVRALFQDGDFIDFPLAQNESFSLQQAAGTTDGVDNVIRVKSAPGSAGALVGWMSASRAPGTSTRVLCNTIT
jgi:hypothetical protein